MCFVSSLEYLVRPWIHCRVKGVVDWSVARGFRYWVVPNSAIFFVFSFLKNKNKDNHLSMTINIRIFFSFTDDASFKGPMHFCIQPRAPCKLNPTQLVLCVSRHGSVIFAYWLNNTIEISLFVLGPSYSNVCIDIKTVIKFLFTVLL